MTHYATCFNCAVDKASCQRRIALQKALAGSAVTSLKFKCRERQAFFAPGQRVAFDWKSFESDEYDTSVLHLTFTGTVIRERGTKFVIQVDSGKDIEEEIEASEVFRKNDALLIKVRPEDMRPLNEPAKSVCLTCYQVEGQEDRCYRSAGQVWVPNGCIKAEEPAPKQEEDAF
ncbi:hypothetical protein [Neorhizobium sp. S3-V5DH]|uniref:hypothetical protein n=1 Tax=Neorhizobium sp. S3-V5DH TaxID=2485166 RepID=UPI0010461379|nr:hypothetical protein [Neorhizobium sp. S3-V5DH]TCV66328.1 hypothetical protein EDE09_11679 [Neorhizobium sp. S3-V5DH]